MSDTETKEPPVRPLPGRGGGTPVVLRRHRLRPRIIALTVFIGGGMIGVAFGGGLPVLFIAAAGVGVTMLVTATTHRGTILQRRTKRARWKSRQRLGTDTFVPFDDAEWDRLQKQAATATKKEQAETAKLIGQMRANPDGSDGMGWLQYSSKTARHRLARPSRAAAVPVGRVRGLGSDSRHGDGRGSHPCRGRVGPVPGTAGVAGVADQRRADPHPRSPARHGHAGPVGAWSAWSPRPSSVRTRLTKSVLCTRSAWRPTRRRSGPTARSSSSPAKTPWCSGTTSSSRGR